MDDSSRDRLGRRLERALELQGDERSRYMESVCGADLAQREELRSLVAAYESSSGYFERLSGNVIDPAIAKGDDAIVENGIGGTVSHYEIVEQIGRGGMGVVFKARDTRLGRYVALKFLPAHLAEDESARARLLAEARAASALDHPNIGIVHEVGDTADGGLFIAMLWYGGETLRELIARGPVPVELAVGIVMQIAKALGAAHDAGIVHRDVKPANVLLPGGDAIKLVDFGIAKMAGSDLTIEGAALGTVAYMSPEQTFGAGVDRRTDIWSLTVVLYEMLTGERPFRGESEQAVIFGIRHDDPEPLTRARPDVSPAIASLVERGLAKDPERRHATASEFVAELRAAAGVAGSEADEDAIPSRRLAGRGEAEGGRRRSRLFRVAASVGVLLAITIGGIAYATRSAPEELDRRRVLVAPFENRTGNPSLDAVGNMAADWMTYELSRTDLVDVVPVTAALTASMYVSSSGAEAGASERLLLLAGETRAGIVVSGAYYRQRDSMYLRATITDVVRNKVLRELAPLASSIDSPLDIIEPLRGELMTALAPHLDPRIREHAALPDFAPPSYDAYKAYAAGLNLFVSRDWRGAIPHLVAASEVDSGFARPLVLAAIAYLNSGSLASVDSLLKVVGPRRASLNEGDRLGFEMLAAIVRGDAAAAHRAHRRYPQIAPGTLAHWGLANSALGVNRPRETIRVSRQLDPQRGELRGWFFYWRDLARAHHRLGEHRAELRVARRSRELFPDEPQAVLLEIRALAAAGRHAELSSILREVLQHESNPAALLREVGLELRAHGYGAHADARLRESLDTVLASPPGSPGHALASAQALAAVGRWADAERLLREQLERTPASLPVHGVLGVAAAVRRDVAEAARISEWLAAQDRPFLNGANTYWRALIAANGGNSVEAVSLLARATREGLGFWDRMHTDPYLSGLRSNTAFRELVRPKG